MAGVELIPGEYGYVILTLVLYCFLNVWMAGRVLKARKLYNVHYPTLYASESENKEAKIFNCVQRGHQNSLEMMPMFFMLMIVGGIKHPSICTLLGLVYIVGRYFYFTGYATGDPKNRISLGRFAFFALLGLLITTISCGIKIVIA
ncbi:hypothetical protein Vadar_012217 [Vaccinium darrowii]|uniref:Uncharacterized protein n=1 Tax=Vaccinium darrowii TaxID=229202 RepID=A0ACB7YEC8_9ERIC|nr:hypothetical protein Vadar_012217 [Vaccinium darrowii]